MQRCRLQLGDARRELRPPIGRPVGLALIRARTQGKPPISCAWGNDKRSSSDVGKGQLYIRAYDEQLYIMVRKQVATKVVLTGQPDTGKTYDLLRRRRSRSNIPMQPRNRSRPYNTTRIAEAERGASRPVTNTST
ncbi:hypothetical protein AB1N83_000255 [Pleurotus pulmonarius]